MMWLKTYATLPREFVLAFNCSLNAVVWFHTLWFYCAMMDPLAAHMRLLRLVFLLGTLISTDEATG